MRDQFAVEVGKIPKPRSGDPASSDYTSKWPYFHTLFFLKDVVKARASSGNCFKETAERTQIEYENSQETEGIEEFANTNLESDINILQNEDPNPNIIQNINKSNDIEINNGENKIRSQQEVNKITKVIKRKRETETWNEQMVNIEKQKLQYFQEKAKQSQVTEKDDDHACFFKSLLPFVRKIPEEKVLLFRGRLQQLVEEFAYGRVPPSGLSPYYRSSSLLSSTSTYSAQGGHILPQRQHHTQGPNADYTTATLGTYEEEIPNLLNLGSI